MIIFAPTGGVQEKIWGSLDGQVYLNIPHKVDSSIEDIRWHNNKNKIAQFKRNSQSSQEEKYEVFKNGTLKIKYLMDKDSGEYSVDAYTSSGAHEFGYQFVLEVQERVSEPNISWNCDLNILTCHAAKGTGTELELYLNEEKNTTHMKNITTKISTKSYTARCIIRNNISEETTQEKFDCSEKGLDIYLIIAICVAGVIFLIFVALLIFYISRRNKRTRQRTDQVEIQVRRVPTRERGQRPLPNPGSSPNPAVGQPPSLGHRPQTPGHHLQVPGQRVPQPGHRVPHSQQRPHHHSGPQVHQQRGPPLPRPRVQPKPPRGAKEHA